MVVTKGAETVPTHDSAAFLALVPTAPVSQKVLRVAPVCW